MNRRPHIAILSFSNIPRDGRVLRQIEYLSQHFDVSVIGYGDLPAQFNDHTPMYTICEPTRRARRLRKALWLPLAKFSTPRFYETWYWSEEEFNTAFDMLCRLRPTAIHANDWEALPVAVRAAQKTGALVVADLHEYAPLMRENRPYWRIFYKPLIEYFLQQCLPSVNATVTVNQTLADKYAETFDIHPLVVMNTPPLVNNRVMQATDPTNIRLVHHGNAERDRHLENMIESVALAQPRYSLHLMLIERNRGYLADLEQLAQRIAPDRAFFHPPVSPQEIVPRISEFDVGLYLLPPQGFNQSAALPNKVFEFVMAGLAVCAGPSLEVARLTQEYGFGLVVPSLDPKMVARHLDLLSAHDIDKMKSKSITASAKLNAETELGKLVHMYRSMTFEADL